MQRSIRSAVMIALASSRILELGGRLWKGYRQSSRNHADRSMDSPAGRTLEYLIGHEPSRAHHTARAVRVNFAAEVHAFAIEPLLQRHAPH